VKPRTMLAPPGLLLALLLPLAAQAQQAGRISGTVTDRAGKPISGVQVFVEARNIGALTNVEGIFQLTNLAVGTYTITTRHIGYADATQRNVRVNAGQATALNFQINESALSLEEVVVTGVQDPIAGVKVPFAIAKISKANVATVPSTKGALESIQGKVAGAYMTQATYQPGENDMQIILRTPISIQQSRTPLILVDGVITTTTALVDMDVANIESVEVVKGAAASSLYGSRAAAGAIAITTSRGRGLNLNQTQIRVRQEVGKNFRFGDYPLAMKHFYKVNEQGQFIKADGTPALRIGDRALDDDHVMDNEYPGPTYTDRNLDALFRPGNQTSTTAELSHFAESTNFLASVTRNHTQGSLVNNDGFTSNTFRLNLDHRLRNDFSFAASIVHLRSYQDDEDGGTPFFNILRTPPDIDLTKKDVNGNYLQLPDSSYPSENPAWRSGTRDNWNKRQTTQMSADLRYNPFSWFNFTGNIAYDRYDEKGQNYTPKGVPTSVTSISLSDGELEFQNELNDRINAGISANLLWNFGDLTTRTTLRTQYEVEKEETFDASAEEFTVENVKDLDWATDPSVNSGSEETRILGYYLQTGLDYAGKYIGDVLIRRDGSSRFGKNQRWHSYGRVAASYRLAQEPWWPFAAITEFKPRYAIGVAGNAPGFTNQYEVWTATGDALPTKNTLGNPDLKPERTVEQEFGLDMIFKNKYQLQLTYARQVTSDQIIQQTIPATSGFTARWENAGQVTGNTLEATFEAQLINRPNFSWSMTFVADKSSSQITEWNRSCLGAANSLGITCKGVQLGDMYVNRFLRSKNNLPRTIAQYAGQFDINDDGYLVWVGEGRTWRDGFSDKCTPRPTCWGATTSLSGYPTTVRWGMPLVELDSLGFFAKLWAGESFPDAQLGWTNTFSFHGLSLYTHLRAQIGGEVYNNTKRNLFTSGSLGRHEEMDQTGKPRERQKPIEYYQVGLGSGETFANTHYIEDASFVKVSQLSLTYTFNQNQLARLGISRMARSARVGLVGRNIFTFTGYTGYDPEIGGTLFKVDQWYYPPQRSLTATVEFTF
jgi:TonB-linked SusC/RagA family outer membrane protein